MEMKILNKYITKGMLQDFKKFTFLEKIAVIIDLVLNPRAINYPIAFYEFENVYQLPDGYIYAFSFKNNKLIYLRWL